MRRAVIIGNNPYRTDYYRRDFRAVFEEMGSNTGNQAITFGVACHMAPTTAFLPWGATVQQIRDAGDVLVFPMANHLGKHTDLERLAERLEEINLPIIGLGLGAQAKSQNEDVQLTPGTSKWLQVITSLSPSDAPNLGVRGSYTQEQIGKLGYLKSSLITGCPSNFINPSRKIAEEVQEGFRRKPRVVAVSAGIPFVPELEKIEQELADIVSLTGGAYIVQHGINMVQIARNHFDLMDASVLENCRRYIMPNRTIGEFTAWCRQYAYAIFDAPGWMDFVRRFDFVVGTRFHGAMFAIQAGVPAGCIAHDSRTLEMCQTMGIPVRHYKEIHGPLTQHNVMDYFEFDAEKYTSLREDLHANFLRIYEAADLEISKEFKKMFA